MPNFLCTLLGHNLRTVISRDYAHYAGHGIWAWPAAITFCPRCGFLSPRQGELSDPAQPPFALPHPMSPIHAPAPSTPPPTTGPIPS